MNNPILKEAVKVQINDLRELAKLLRMFTNDKGGRDLTEDQVSILCDCLNLAATTLEKLND